MLPRLIPAYIKVVKFILVLCTVINLSSNLNANNIQELSSIEPYKELLTLPGINFYSNNLNFILQTEIRALGHKSHYDSFDIYLEFDNSNTLIGGIILIETGPNSSPIFIPIIPSSLPLVSIVEVFEDISCALNLKKFSIYKDLSSNPGIHDYSEVLFSFSDTIKFGQSPCSEYSLDNCSLNSLSQIYKVKSEEKAEFMLSILINSSFKSSSSSISQMHNQLSTFIDTLIKIKNSDPELKPNNFFKKHLSFLSSLIDSDVLFSENVSIIDFYLICMFLKNSPDMDLAPLDMQVDYSKMLPITQFYLHIVKDLNGYIDYKKMIKLIISRFFDLDITSTFNQKLESVFNRKEYDPQIMFQKNYDTDDIDNDQDSIEENNIDEELEDKVFHSRHQAGLTTLIEFLRTIYKLAVSDSKDAGIYQQIFTTFFDELTPFLTTKDFVTEFLDIKDFFNNTDIDSYNFSGSSFFTLLIRYMSKMKNLNLSNFNQEISFSPSLSYSVKYNEDLNFTSDLFFKILKYKDIDSHLSNKEGFETNSYFDSIYDNNEFFKETFVSNFDPIYILYLEDLVNSRFDFLDSLFKLNEDLTKKILVELFEIICQKEKLSNIDMIFLIKIVEFICEKNISINIDPEKLSSYVKKLNMLFRVEHHFASTAPELEGIIQPIHIQKLIQLIDNFLTQIKLSFMDDSNSCNSYFNLE